MGGHAPRENGIPNACGERRTRRDDRRLLAGGVAPRGNGSTGRRAANTSRKRLDAGESRSRRRGRFKGEHAAVAAIVLEPRDWSMMTGRTSVRRSIRSVGRSVDRWVGRSIGRSVCHLLIGRPVGRSRYSRSIGWLTGLVGRSFRSIGRSVCQSVDPDRLVGRFGRSIWTDSRSEAPTRRSRRRTSSPENKRTCPPRRDRSTRRGRPPHPPAAGRGDAATDPPPSSARPTRLPPGLSTRRRPAPFQRSLESIDTGFRT